MLYYITGNQNKIDVARKFLTPLGIEFEPKELDLTEIQSENIEEVAISKAKQAFEILQQPLFTNDHGWSITALNGFPGAYMKYINKWLTADDFIRLMDGKENREAILTEVICFIDEKGTKAFTMQHNGKILDKPQGVGIPGTTMISLSDDGISIAKKLETNPSAVENYTLWKELADWYKAKNK